MLQKFDDLIAKERHQSRSEAFRDLIRAELVKQSQKSVEGRVVGTITLVYDHHTRLLQEKLTDLQHEHHHSILSTLHIHLDHDYCLEVIVAGKFGELQELADSLISTKGSNTAARIGRRRAPICSSRLRLVYRRQGPKSIEQRQIRNASVHVTRYEDS